MAALYENLLIPVKLVKKAIFHEMDLKKYWLVVETVKLAVT